MLNFSTRDFLVTCWNHHRNKRLHIFFDIFCFHFNITSLSGRLLSVDDGSFLNDDGFLDEYFFIGLVGICLSNNFNLFLRACMIDILFDQFLFKLGFDETSLCLKR